MGTTTDIDPNPLSTTGWHETFYDGFNGAWVDTAAWPILQWGWGANGAFQYNPANVFEYGGELNISNQASPSGWTSGAMQQGWNGQLYGRYEIRAAFDAGQGTTAAILLWPTDGSSPYEIDIVEPRDAAKTLNNTTIHGPTDAITVPFNYDATQWHTYTLDWLPNKIDLYLDGTLILETYDRIPDVPMSLGFLGYVTNGGDTWFGGAPNAETPAVNNLHVDWVRIYTPDAYYPGELPAALYGTSLADLQLTTDPYTGVWTAGPVTEYARTGVRSLGDTNYAATWNAGQWDDQVMVVQDAPTTWDPSYASRLLFANFVEVELNFQAAGSTALDLVVSGAQHGNIALGDGNNSLTWVEHNDSLAGADAAMTIVTGNGNNNIELTAPVYSSIDEPFAWGAEWHGDYDGHASTALVRTGSGTDTITIDAGQAVIDAGAGDDTVVFHNPQSRFVVAVAADGATMVTDTQGIMGTDLLYNVEHIQFSDGTINTPSNVPDPNPIQIGPIGSTPGGPSAGDPPPSQTLTQTIGSGSDSFVLKLSQDAYQGDAQFTVSVDGQQVGGTLSAMALHSSGQDDTLTVLGNWGAGGHTVTVNFINDAYGGTSDTDRNLYVDSATYDGQAMTPASATLLSSGPASFSINGGATPGTGALDWNTIGAAQQAYFEQTGHWWNGDYATLVAMENGSAPPPSSPPPETGSTTTDWNALAAEVMANHAATGQWFA